MDCCIFGAFRVFWINGHMGLPIMYNFTLHIHAVMPKQCSKIYKIVSMSKLLTLATHDYYVRKVSPDSSLQL